ncbi:MAG: hypothetical protein AB7V77_01070 [Candidatus Woesearchaeota archaeon]
MILETLLVIFVGLLFLYIIVVFLLSPLILPNLGWKSKINDDLPKKVIKDLEEIGKKYKSKKKVLDKILEYEFDRFESKMFQQFTEFPLLFVKSLNDIWKRKGYLHCHQQNLLIRYFLLKTKRFTEDDIKLKITNCYFMIHQYIKVKVENNKWLNVDPFAMRMGEPKHKVLFGSIENLKKK